MMIKEACVETVEDAIRAEELGADRIELCSRLDLDGLTPSPTLFHEVRAAIKIPIHVMIRVDPRTDLDDFIIDAKVLGQMAYSIESFMKMDIQGFVFGMLTPEKWPDLAALEELSRLLQGFPITFHKAIDSTPDPIKAFDMIQDTGLVAEILTSGGAPSALEGAEVLQKMILRQKSTSVKVAGKVTSKNLGSLHKVLGASAYHGRKIVE